MTKKPISCAFLALTVLALPLAVTACADIEGDELAYLSPADEPTVPPRNSPSQIWRSGYWQPSEDGTFEWIPGEMIERPSPTAVWNPARWVKHSYGWSFQDGHWQ
jgi:hypothetical protein